MEHSQIIKHLDEIPRALRKSGVGMIFAFCLLSIGTTSRAQVYATSDELRQDYDALGEMMITTDGEVAKVQDFVYKKDAATFTFSEGTFLLRRPVAGRPTVAVFVGKGNVSVPIPLEVERRCLESIAGDTAVNETFDVCYIRFADNLDVALREKFEFTSGGLSARDSRSVKKVQGDYFFKPLDRHRIDNCFQLLRSVRNRSDNGYFWAKFNQYIFTYDPKRAEEVSVYFDRKPTSIIAFQGARFPRESRAQVDPLGSGGVEYPTTCVKQHTQLELGGPSGYKILSAVSKMWLLANKDSTRFLTIFLHDNHHVDSIWCEEGPLPFHRRREWDHLGIALPGTYAKGDTIEINIKYHGDEYGGAFPSVANPMKFPHSLTVTAPKTYNYMFVSVVDTVNQSGGSSTFDVHPSKYQSRPLWAAWATGWDTLAFTTSFGLPVHCTVPEDADVTKITKKYSLLHDESRECFLRAFELMYRILGEPPLETDLYVVDSRGNTSTSLTGYIRMPSSITLDTDYGGFSFVAARAAALQWFSSTVKPATYRERWIGDALPYYLGLMFVEIETGTKTYARHLSYLGETVRNVVDKKEDLPLAAGVSRYVYKGAWLIHMLRNLMNTTSPVKDQTFKAWLKDMVQYASAQTFTNKDIQTLAEKHFGYDLTCFFDKWLYGTGIVEYDIDYAISKGDDGYYLDMNVVTTGVKDDYLSPVLVRVETESAPMHFEAFITPKVTKYQYGPFEEKPQKFLFNQYLSMLSNEKISKVGRL